MLVLFAVELGAQAELAATSLSSAAAVMELVIAAKAAATAAVFADQNVCKY